AAGARRPVVEPEAAEAADLDAMAAEQALRHRIEDHLHRVLGVLRHQLRIALGEARDQFRLGHASLPSPWRYARLFLRVGAALVPLGAQQRAEVGGAGARRGVLAAQLLHGVALLRQVLRLHRKVDRAVLAVDVDDHRLHAVAFLQVLGEVVDAVARELGGTQVTLDTGDVYDGALGVHALHRAAHHAVLLVAGDEVGERVALELLHAQRDALALDVDRQHHGL